MGYGTGVASTGLACTSLLSSAGCPGHSWSQSEWVCGYVYSEKRNLQEAAVRHFLGGKHGLQVSPSRGCSDPDLQEVHVSVMCNRM